MTGPIVGKNLAHKKLISFQTKVLLGIGHSRRNQFIDWASRALGHKTQRIQRFLRIFAPHRIHHQAHLLGRDL
jgi:hypothetical protein